MKGARERKRGRDGDLSSHQDSLPQLAASGDAVGLVDGIAQAPAARPTCLFVPYTSPMWWWRDDNGEDALARHKAPAKIVSLRIDTGPIAGASKRRAPRQCCRPRHRHRQRRRSIGFCLPLPPTRPPACRRFLLSCLPLVSGNLTIQAATLVNVRECAPLSRRHG